MTPQKLEDTVVSHADLMDRIEQHETRVIKAFLWMVSTLVPLAIASFIWIWASHSAQAGVNAQIEARLLNHEKTEDRVLMKLDELSLFLREDSRELRQEMLEHIKEAKAETKS